jgi:FtsP/CotA-like multicopper oxidase with cupredoxin domain
VNAVVAGMDGGPEEPVLVGAPYRVVALDGRDLSGPGELGPERVPLGMGQRADLVFTMPATGAVRLYETQVQGGRTAIQRALTPATSPARHTVTFGSGGAPALPDLRGVHGFDPLRYGTPAADPVAAAPATATHPIVIADGPGFHDGRVELVHSINGQASPNVPPIVVHEGDMVRLHIVNTTGEYHPMHLHGNTMSVLSRDGVPVSGSPVRLDSVLVGPHETLDVAFLADNPGIWMLHCHILIHASFGLMMTVNYEGVSTPYTVGMLSGNVPE